MDKFRIFETDEFTKALSNLDSTDRKFIEQKLRKQIYPQLREQPHFGPNIKKLKSYQPDTWRYRLGQYRLFYGVDTEANIVFILTVDFRKDTYR